MLEHLRERARGQRLREPRVVLEQDVPVGEEPEEDELERIALPDDRLLDLVEDADRRAPVPRRAPRLHGLQRSRRPASSSCGEMPRLSRSSGAARSGRTSSQAASPRAACAQRRARSRARSACATQAGRRRSSAAAGRSGSGGRTTRRLPARPRARSGRGSPAGDVELALARRASRSGRLRRERSSQSAGGRARRRSRRARAHRCEPRGRARPGAKSDDRDERERREDEEPERADGGRASRRSLDRPSVDRSGCRRISLRHAAARPGPARERRSPPPSSCCRCSCWENLACVKSAVSRAIASEPSARSPRTRARYSSDVSAGRRAMPFGREHALHSRVRRDDRAARVGLGAEVVERLVEHDGEFLRELPATAPSAARARRSATTYAITAATTRPTTIAIGSHETLGSYTTLGSDRASSGRSGLPPNGGSSSTGLLRRRIPTLDAPVRERGEDGDEDEPARRASVRR